MRDLTRAEQETLVDLLGVLIANGRGGLDDQRSLVVQREILSLIHAAERVRDACALDLANQKG